MDVWVILQLSAPGVEHTEEAGVIGAEEARIVHQGLDGLGGGREQRVVAQFLVAA
jgi:hypothetical protein